ncbi:hypothetical protein Aca07nite_81540 [Actinoplanes capillaceus]|uniref:Uncharacterized protein n=1 Tax=Actinoplanes campanulatus TaxID=113559 RepID=A0ABQ3WXF0_9ACTN|nr:hypothetical protein [Actinoplanes capillaceus]GID50879.1 hypothetical protein Aca07nite_81540 [Actinoplanes capillaceus]
MSLQWWSIEILDGPLSSAERWRDSHEQVLLSAAVSHGAQQWAWHPFRWGLLLEIAFKDAEAWPAFRELPAVQAALDAVPDPVNGLLIYPGRGGSAGHLQPRRPRPTAGAGAAPLPREPVRTRVTLAETEPAPTRGGVLIHAA